MPLYKKKPNYGGANYDVKNQHQHGDYAGLKNQGATCYLNSLMQTLFMTPEFRNAIYNTPPPSGINKWSSFDEQSLLFQMQKLFVMLQTSKGQAVDTCQFTASLGTCWAFRPYEQRDSHELLRCIFDTLEEIWQPRGANHGGVDGKSPIQQFYRGTLDDYIACSICRKEEAEEVRHEPFLDIPLALKALDGRTPLTSIEESLHAYRTAQLLDDEPCEHCKHRGGLIKGFNFAEFPYILTLQLKRFDMNWHTMQRYKVNDQMEFPAFLDLSNHINRQFAAIEHDAGEPMDLDDNVWAEDCSAPSSDTPINGQNGGEKQQENFLYQLFAVIAHSGSSTGGHYFSYIKDMEQEQWLCFNDSVVYPVNWDEVASTFGGGCHGRNYYSGGTNAYVLMYRKEDPKRNEQFMRTSEFPAHLTAIIKDENEKKNWLANKLMRARQKKQQLNAITTGPYQTIQHKVDAYLPQQPMEQAQKNNQQSNSIHVDDVRIDMEEFEEISAQNVVPSTAKIVEKGLEQQQWEYAQKQEFSQQRDDGGDQQQEASNWAYQQAVENAVAGNVALASRNVQQQSQNEPPPPIRPSNNSRRRQQQYWVFLSRKYEPLKQRHLMERIEQNQLILQATMDIWNKSHNFQLGTRMPTMMERQVEGWKKEFTAKFDELSWNLSLWGDIFSSLNIHVVLLTKEGRQLFSGWLYLLRKNGKQEKINGLLQSMLDCLAKMAVNASSEEAKAISIEICRNFKYYNSLHILAVQAKRMYLKEEMVAEYELLQRALFWLLSKAVGLKWRYFSPDFFKITPWGYFLGMPSALLKFDPFEEMRAAPSSNDNLHFGYLRNKLYALFHYIPKGSQPIFNEHSVAFLLANKHAASYPLIPS